MSFNATFYVFGKRRNSTALPTNGTTSAVVPILLKDECDAETPILEIDSQDPDNYFNYTFCYIPFFNRYYFVKGWKVNTGRRLYAELEEDYLGSFKSAIQLSSGFIKYSAQGLTSIPDPRICRTINYAQNVATASFPDEQIGNGYFIAVTGTERTDTYYISKANLLKLFEDVDWRSHSMSAGSDDKATITNFGNMLGALFDDMTTQGNIYKNLRSAYVLPIKPSEEQLSAPTTVYAGHYNTQIEAQRLLDPVYSFAIAISIPWLYSDWRRCSPYSNVSIYLPFFGVIPLDVNTIIESSYLTVKYSLCYTDGSLSYSIETESNRIIATGNTNVRSEYGIGSSNVGISAFPAYVASLASGAPNTQNLIARTIESMPIFKAGKAAAEYITGNEQNTFYSTLSAVGAALNTASGALDSFGNSVSTAGGLGGVSATGLERRLKCWVQTKDFADVQANFATIYGYPLFQVASFSGKSGFLQTDSFYFDYSGANQNEKDVISSMLNSGIYIE